METAISLTGITIVYEGNLIYWCSNPEIIEQFKAYLDSTELKSVDNAYLWLVSENKDYYLKIEPERSGKFANAWFVTVNNETSFIFTHEEGRNLLDEIEEKLYYLCPTHA